MHQCLFSLASVVIVLGEWPWHGATGTEFQTREEQDARCFVALVPC